MFGAIAWIWIGVIIGAAIGTWLKTQSYRAIIKLKSIDGTGEYIDGEFYHILSEKDYNKYVLGIK